MSGQERSSKASQDSLLKIVGIVFQGLMTLYLLAMLVGLPLFFTDGYTTIGTDKAMFFRKCGILMGVVILPVAILYAGLLNLKKNRSKNLLDCEISKTTENESKSSLSKTDVFAMIFFASLPLSFVLSDYKEQAVWGARGWYMGLIPQAIVMITFFLVSKLWKPKKWVLGAIFFVSLLIFSLGYLNRFGIYPIPMRYAMPSFISTIGNINWYCGYVVTVFFLSVFLYWSGVFDRNILWKILGTLYLFFGFATLVTQGSASGLVTVFVMLLILLVRSGDDIQKLMKFWEIAFCMSFSCLITDLFRVLFPEAMVFDDWYISILTKGWFPILVTIVSVVFLMMCDRGYRAEKEGKESGKKIGKTLKKVNLAVVILTVLSAIAFVVLMVIKTMADGGVTISSYTDFFHFSGTWGSNRGATWMAGLFSFAKQNIIHKLLGVGPDCMSAYLKSCKDPWLRELLKECFGGAVLTNAHNEWLNILVNEGLLGAIGFIGMMCSSIREFLARKGEQRGLLKTYVTENRLIAAACGFSLLAYTNNNMFSFQQSVNLVTMFILLGIGKAFYSKKDKLENSDTQE